MSDPCTWPVTCIYQCTPNGGDCPAILSHSSNHTHSIPINTEVKINLWGNDLFLFKTDRQLNYSYKLTAVNGIDCAPNSASGTGSISENCVFTETKLLYVNQTEQVALYKETTQTLIFSGGSEGFVAVAVGYPMMFLKVAVRSESFTKTSKIVMLQGTTETILDSYTEESLYDPHRFFLFPTPEPSMAGGIPLNDPELTQYGFYNAYGNCYEEATPGSLVVLDGGRYMFFPEWLRNFVTDPYVAKSRDQRFLWCQTGVANYGTVEIPLNVLNLVPSIPCGSYVKHSELGVMYNFFIEAVSHSGMINVKSSNIDGEIIAVVEKYDPTFGLGPETIYYPISLI